MFARIRCFLFLMLFHISSGLSASESESILQPVQSIDPSVGSWTFSGLVKNESGDKFGYFFEVQRQDSEFHTKAALIDGESNQLIFFYEGKEKLQQSTTLDWHVGYSFIRFNPINDSWIFGVKTAEKKGFNFKVDMLKQTNNMNDMVLRPGIKFQVLQTSQLNGHILTGDKEQFVTGNKAWFGKLLLNHDQKESHEISTTFCRLNDDNGFYSANLKEKDATSAAVAGWLDPLGNKVKMSQFVSMKPLENDQCMLSIGWPKLNLKLINTLKSNDSSPHTLAGFSKEGREGFCFMTQESFLKNTELAMNPVNKNA